MKCSNINYKKIKESAIIYDWIINIIYLLFIITIVYIWKNEYLILGGEGNYFVDFKSIQDLYNYAWHPYQKGVGSPNPLINFPFVIMDFFALLQQLGFSIKTINSLGVVLVYYLPFLTMYWLLRGIYKYSTGIALIITFFYVINPVSTYHLQTMMFWNVAMLYIFPLVFGIIYKLYLEDIKLFFVFGIVTVILSYSFSNVPYLGVFHIFLIISLIIIHTQRVNTFDYLLIFKKFIILELSFVLFNAWWILNLFRFQIQDLKSVYTKEFAVNWAKQTSSTDDTIISEILTLKANILSESDYFLSFFSSIPTSIILFVPIIVISLMCLQKKHKDHYKKVYFIIIIFILFIVFLNKGITSPFSDIYLWLMDNVPYFIIFKSPLEKFALLLIFLITLCLSLCLYFNNKPWIYYIFIVYLLVCIIPYLTLNFMPKFYVDNNTYISRKFAYKESYSNIKKSLNTDKLNYKYLMLPGNLNYQVTLSNHNNKFYRGMDPLAYSIRKPFIAAYSADSPNLDLIFDNLSTKLKDDILKLYNIKYIIINKDIYPYFELRNNLYIYKSMAIFSKNYKKKSFDSISMFKNKDFLPKIYIPNTESFSTITEGFNTDFAKSCPTIEYKKINPTKYRIRIHEAKEDFPIVFSEGYHKGWNLYLTKCKPTLSNKERYALNQKFTLRADSADTQASKEQILCFIKKGWISYLYNADKFTKHTYNFYDKQAYDIKFISNKIGSTIQNNNMPNGHFYETWFNQQIDNKFHLKCNEYANCFYLNIDKLCNQSQACHQNINGTFDIEMVLEFSPQRFVYIGIFITTIALLICFFYIFYCFIRYILYKNT